MRLPYRPSFTSLALTITLALSGTQAALAAGTLTFYTQGEDLATEGFVAPKLTKDGWSLRFDHIFVTLAEVTAYQTDPPFDPSQSDAMSITHQVSLPGVYTVDLVQEAGDDDRLVVASIDAAPGHYNALSWRMVPASDGPAAGQVILFKGIASRDDVTVPFTLSSAQAHGYLCGEYVGDERKGFVSEGGSAEVEMTFHLDHLFGRADRDADDPMNLDALGFDVFAEAEQPTQFDLRGLHLGHAGEGHCRVLWD